VAVSLVILVSKPQTNYFLDEVLSMKRSENGEEESSNSIPFSKLEENEEKVIIINQLEELESLEENSFRSKLRKFSSNYDKELKVIYLGVCFCTLFIAYSLVQVRCFFF
jgi:hypothetical protein